MFSFQRISLVLIIILTIQDVKPQGLSLKEKQPRQIDVSSIINGSEEEEEEEEATTTTTTEKTTTELVEYYEEEEVSNKTTSTAPDLAEYEYEYYYEEVDEGNVTVSNLTTISPPTAENSTNEFNLTTTPTPTVDETTTETSSIFRKLLLNRLNATEFFTESTTTEVTTTEPPEEHPLPVLTPEDVQVFQMIKHQMNASMANHAEGHSPQLEPEELLLEAIMSLNAKDIETFLTLKEIHDEFVVFDIVNISKTTKVASTSTTSLPVTEETLPPPPPTATEVTLVKQMTPTSTLAPAISTSKPERQGIIASVRNLVKSGNFNRMGLLSLLKQTRSTVEYLEDIGLVNEFSAPLVIADDLWGGLESIVG